MLKYPNQTLSDGKNTVTYSELINYAEGFGLTLKKQSAKKYGILFNSDFFAAKALMACLYAKKTAVLLNKKYGEEHTAKIIKKTELSFLITEKGIIKISEEKKEKENLKNVAFIMCTSGTTGTPKGAMITEKNILANLKDIREYFLINNKDRILISRPLYHCAVLTGEFLISLINGLKIFFISEGFVPAKILKRAKEENITVLCGTPTLLYHISKLNLKSKNPLRLLNIAVSGECITETVAKTVRESFKSANIYNVYGLTEASPRVTFLKPENFNKYPTSVGKPLKSVKVKTVNNEIAVFGKNIMKGYYNEKDKTKKAIVNGWLYTGDIGYIDKDGNIYINGRKDNMIIRAGMNIYPQEIENALKENELIEDVLAFGTKEKTVGEKIHIKVVSPLTKQQIYNICKQKLLSYEMPDDIEIVENIPKNASGKVIRNAYGN